MKISTLFYCFWQGFKNIFRNKWFTLASLATISACLFLFGLFYSLLTNFEHMVKTTEEKVSVTAYLEKEISEDRLKEIESILSKRVEIREIEYVSAEEAWEEFKKSFEEYADGYLENPLEDCAHFNIYMSDVSMQPTLVSYLETVEGIRQVNKSVELAQLLTGFNSIIGYVSIGIIVILFAVSIFLISNTVTIGISVRKEEIQIMKYVGATDFFVRSPFVIEGMLIGLIGSIIPLAGIYVIYNQVMLYAAERFPFMSKLLQFLPVEVIFKDLTPVCIGIGVGIGFLGSFTTVRKHLSV